LIWRLLIRFVKRYAKAGAQKIGASFEIKAKYGQTLPKAVAGGNLNGNK